MIGVEKLILDFIRSYGVARKVTINSPLLLNDPEKLWLVGSGKVNICTINKTDERLHGQRGYFFTSFENEILLGRQIKRYDEVVLIADVSEDCMLYEIELSMIRELVLNSMEYRVSIVKLVESWVNHVYEGLSENNTFNRPPTDVLIDKQTVLTVPGKSTISTNRSLVWCMPADAAQLRINGFEFEEDKRFVENTGNPLEEYYLPLSRKSFFRSLDEVEVKIYSTQEIIGEAKFWQSLELFYGMALEIELKDLVQTKEEEQERLMRKYEDEALKVENALNKVNSVFSGHTSRLMRASAALHSSDNFFRASAIVAGHIDVKLVVPHDLASSSDPIGDISRYSRVRYREVLLEGRWYKREGAALLGFLRPGNQPVAIMPRDRHSYEVFNPKDNSSFIVDKTNEHLLERIAYMFYKPLPNKKLTLSEVIDFSLLQNKGDYVRLVVMGLLTTLLGMGTPILTAVLYDHIIPNAEREQLIHVGFALFVASVSGIMFELAKNYALLRIEVKANSTLQAAVWDRLLDLPTSFFRKFTAGDLASRSIGINQIRHILSGVVVTSILGSLFSSLNFFLLFYYSVPLAMIALGLVLLQIVIMYGLGRWQIGKQRIFYNYQGKTSGIVLQLLSGVSKFRVTGTEIKAFLHWLKHFLEMKEASLRAAHIQNIQHVLNVSFGMVSIIVIYIAMVKLTDTSHITTGQFLSFMVAYTTFMGAMIAMSESMLTVLQIFPIYERTKPILEETPENDGSKQAPEKLKGNIELNHVNFRYEKDGQQILSDLSISIEQGEYVAFVGPSGSGKSTIVRLLLGFETPDSGSILYDGQELKHLDVKLLRRQLGVVLQDSKLIPGDIFNNIIGSAVNLSMDDAWEAAKSAAFDDDIRHMPMGMHTMISDGSNTLSGGQRQRLMIARAIIHKPKILIFDEATSALDNRTQKIVTDSLDKMQITRVVVAHRLSTIVNADKIYYLEGGRIVESGSYEQLMAQKGRFYELAARQVE